MGEEGQGVLCQSTRVPADFMNINDSVILIKGACGKSSANPTAQQDQIAVPL